MMLATL